MYRTEKNGVPNPAQGATEGPKSACVPVRMARRQSGVAGTTGTDGEAGPRGDGAVSGPSPRPATHDADEEGRVRVCWGRYPALRAVDSPPRVPDKGTAEGRDGGQIMGRDPQKEEWAADTAPDVETLQKLLSNLENQRAVWPQIRAF